MVGHEHRIGVIDAVAGEAAQAQHLPLRLGEIADAGNIGLPPAIDLHRPDQRVSPTVPQRFEHARVRHPAGVAAARSEEHTSELQSLMRISYAVFCLTKKNKHKRERTY